MPEPPVAESHPFVWRPPLRLYELPPRRPVALTKRERQEAVSYWQQLGVLGPDGRPSDRWKTTLGAIFG